MKPPESVADTAPNVLAPVARMFALLLVMLAVTMYSSAQSRSQTGAPSEGAPQQRSAGLRPALDEQMLKSHETI